MRYFKLMCDCMYAITLGGFTAAGLALGVLSVKKCIESCCSKKP